MIVIEARPQAARRHRRRRGDERPAEPVRQDDLQPPGRMRALETWVIVGRAPVPGERLRQRSPEGVRQVRRAHPGGRLPGDVRGPRRRRRHRRRGARGVRDRHEPDRRRHRRRQDRGRRAGRRVAGRVGGERACVPARLRSTSCWCTTPPARWSTTRSIDRVMHGLAEGADGVVPALAVDRYGEAAGAGRRGVGDVRPRRRCVPCRRRRASRSNGSEPPSGRPADRSRRPPTARRWSRPPAAGWCASRATRATSR